MAKRYKPTNLVGSTTGFASSTSKKKRIPKNISRIVAPPENIILKTIKKEIKKLSLTSPYTPINLYGYIAAQAGAAAGMGVGGWITDPTPTDYNLVSLISAAFAQAFDQAWNNAALIDVLEQEAITAIVAQELSGRAPGPLSDTAYQQVSTWAKSATACVALVQETDATARSQGINPPLVPTGGSSTPIYPLGPVASWSIPKWYIDPANSTGHASDSNNGTTVLTPLLTFQRLAQLWTSLQPVLAQQTSIQWLSDAPTTGDPIVLTPRIVEGGSLIIYGNPTEIGSGVLGTVVSKNRATAQLLTANLGASAATYVGCMLHNITRNAWCWVDSVVGDVATLTQPLTPSFTDPSNPSTYTHDITEVDTFTSGDSYVIWKMTKIQLEDFRPICTINAAYALTYMANIWITDNGGAGTQVCHMANSALAFTNYRSDRQIIWHSEQSQEEPGWQAINAWLYGSFTAYGDSFPTIYGGAIDTYGVIDPSYAFVNGPALFDYDTIVHGDITGLPGIGCSIGNVGAYFDGNASGIASIFSTVWGPGGLDLGGGGTTTYLSPAVTNILLTGASNSGNPITIDGVAFATACDRTFEPAPWYPARALTPANLDATIAAGGFDGTAYGDDGTVITNGVETITTPVPFVYPSGPIYNVQSYGAKGDGVTDDTVAINTTITAALSTGGTVLFPHPSVTYKITAALLVNPTSGNPGDPANICLEGDEGAGTVGDPYQTITQYSYGLPCFQCTASNITIRDLSGSYGPTTTLSAPTTIGATSISVVSAAGISPNDWIIIDQPWALREQVQVLSILGNTITLQTATPIQFVHNTGAWVRDQPNVTLPDYYGQASRNNAYFTSIMFGSYCTIEDCAAVAMIGGVYLGGNPFNNSILANSQCNSIKHLDTDFCQFGILGQQQSILLINHPRYTNATNGQTAAPGHSIYLTGRNGPASNWAVGNTYELAYQVVYSGNQYISLVAGNHGHQPDISPAYWALQSNTPYPSWWTTNASVRIVSAYASPGSSQLNWAGFTLKYTNGATVIGAVIEFADRSFNMQECSDVTFSDFSFRNFVPPTNTDGNAAALDVLNCNRCTFGPGDVDLTQFGTIPAEPGAVINMPVVLNRISSSNAASPGIDGMHNTFHDIVGYTNYDAAFTSATYRTVGANYSRFVNCTAVDYGGFNHYAFQFTEDITDVIYPNYGAVINPTVIGTTHVASVAAGTTGVVWHIDPNMVPSGPTYSDPGGGAVISDHYLQNAQGNIALYPQSTTNDVFDIYAPASANFKWVNFKNSVGQSEFYINSPLVGPLKTAFETSISDSSSFLGLGLNATAGYGATGTTFAGLCFVVNNASLGVSQPGFYAIAAENQASGALGTDIVVKVITVGTTTVVSAQRWYNNGDTIVNATGAQLATAATGGFFGVPNMAGQPTGTPAAYTGSTTIVGDTTNHTFWCYFGGYWFDIRAELVTASAPTTGTSLQPGSFTRLAAGQSGNTYHLPDPTTCKGSACDVQCVSNGATYTYTIDTPLSGLIDGAATYTFSSYSAFQRVSFRSDGVNWWSNDLPAGIVPTNIALTPTSTSADVISAQAPVNAAFKWLDFTNSAGQSEVTSSNATVGTLKTVLLASGTGGSYLALGLNATAGYATIGATFAGINFSVNGAALGVGQAGIFANAAENQASGALGTNLLFKVIPAGTSTPVAAFQLSNNGDIVCNITGAQLSTAAIGGFFNIPNMTGMPTGAATAYTGSTQIVADTVNHTLWVTWGGTWYDHRAQIVTGLNPASGTTLLPGSFTRVGSGQNGYSYVLPDPTKCKGSTCTIQCNSSGGLYTYTITSAGSANINNASSYTFVANSVYAQVTFESDGTQWWTLVSPVYQEDTPAFHGFIEWNGNPQNFNGATVSVAAALQICRIPMQVGGLISNITACVTTLGSGFTAATVATISNCANNGSGLIRVTATAHGFSSNDIVVNANVTGTVEANGAWQITVIDANTYDLIGSVFVNAYVSGGTGTRSANCCAIYSSTGAFLSATADQIANWNSTGEKTMALATPITVAKGSVIYVVVLFNGTASTLVMRQFGGGTLGSTGGNLGLAGATLRWATNGATGVTKLPASFSPATNATTSSLSLFVALS